MTHLEVRRLRAWWGAMPGAYRPHLKLYRGQAVRILTLSGWEWPKMSAKVRAQIEQQIRNR